MSQQDFVLTLHAEGQSTTEIHRHLVQVFGELAIAYSTVSRTIRALRWAAPDEEARNLCGRPPNLTIDARIQQFLIDNPGRSIRQIATGTRIPASVVWHVLTARLEYVWRKCRPAPDTLSKAKRVERLQRSQVLLITCRGRTLLLGVLFRQAVTPGSFIALHIGSFGFLPMWRPLELRGS
jgi:hypothetical protein